MIRPILVVPMILILAGCSSVTRTVTDPETGIVETTVAKSKFRKGMVTIQDGAGATVITDQTIDAEIINAADIDPIK